MRTILIIGAGRSASSLIKYLLNKAETERLHLTIADLSLELAQKKTNNHPNATPIQLDIANIEERQQQIQKADIVISMLPAHLHVEIAEDCIIFKKHMDICLKSQHWIINYIEESFRIFLSIYQYVTL